jgi:hypothetical protein
MSRRFYSPLAPPESPPADLRLRRSRCDSGLPLSAMRPWAPDSSAVRAHGRRRNGPRTRTGRTTDEAGTGHGRGRKNLRTGPVGAVSLTAPTRIPTLTWHFRRPARCRHHPRYPGLAWCLGCRARRRCAGWRRWHGVDAVGVDLEQDRDPLPGAARKFVVRAIVTATRACPSRRVFSAGSTSMTRRREAATRDSSASSSSSWSSIALTCSPFKGLTTKHERGARRGSGRGGLCLRCRRRVSRCARETRIGECARR